MYSSPISTTTSHSFSNTRLLVHRILLVYRERGVGEREKERARKERESNTVQYYMM